MYTRLLITAPIGSAITVCILFAMHLLIDSRAEVMTDASRTRYHLDFIRLREAPPEVIEDIVKPPPKPADVPRERPPSTGDGPVGPYIPVNHAPPPVTGPGEQIELGISDGPLVTVMRAEPQYPLRMASAGIEGYATVAFDVDGSGAVINARVIDSSHRAFERPALDAVQRFKYRPRIVDGEGVTTPGLRYRFRFDMP